MNTVREYRVPLLIGAGTLVVALLLWVALVSPQNSKLSSLQTQQTQLQSQQTALQGKLASLRTEQRKLSTSCADLQKITTQIPSVQNPTDVDAEESSFESQFNALAASTGVALSQFSGFAPATTAATAPAATTPSGTTPGVVAVPTNLAVTGTYAQMVAFVNGLDTFPRLFVIQKFVLSFGAVAPGSAGATSASASASAAVGAPPLWTGGTPTAPSAAPYNLAITGSIYYTSTPSALAACTKAIEVSK
jgi:Tfp pilus assembly protein PilO